MSINARIDYIKEKIDIYITNGARADLLGVLLLAVFILGNSYVIITITTAVLLLCLYRIYKNKSILPFSPIIYLIPTAYIANIWLPYSTQFQYGNALIWLALSVLYVLYETIFKRISARNVLIYNAPDPIGSGYKSEKKDIMTIFALPVSLVGFIATIGSSAIAMCIGLILIASLAVRSVYLLANRAESLREDENAVRVIEQYKPAFAIFFSLGKPSQNNYAMWDEYFKKVDKPFIVITPQRKHFEPLAKITTMPVVYCKSPYYQERVIVASGMKAIFYPINSGNNLAPMTVHSVHHVHIGHGDSDKVTSYRSVTAMYDKIFVAGQAAIDRYENNGVLIPKDKFMIVGRPQVEGIEPSRKKVKSVLYAPTWHGDVEAFDYSSLYLGREIVQELLDKGLRVVFRPHPSSRLSDELSRVTDDIYSMLAKDKTNSHTDHIYGKEAEIDMDIIDCMNKSDMMISDVSSVISDYLYSEKPMVLVAMKESIDSFVATYPTAKAAYVLDSRLKGYAAILDSIVAGDDSMVQARKNMKSYYLGRVECSKPYSSIFVSSVKKVLGASNPRNKRS